MSPTMDALVFRVAMLGSSGVGKSSICSQFLSSEHINTYVTVEDSIQKEVSLDVDGLESKLIFVDHSFGEMSVENMMMTYNPSAYIIVFSVDDQETLDHAEKILSYLRMSGVMEETAVILVANKTDLVRSRIVRTPEGRAVASKYSVKYIETSPGINHHVDELLVGVLSQITLRLYPHKKPEVAKNKVMQFLGKVLNLPSDRSGNLNVL